MKILQLDLSKPEESMEKVKAYLRMNGFDIVINNAGLTMREEFVNTSFETC